MNWARPGPQDPPQVGKVRRKEYKGMLLFESEIAHIKGVGRYANDAWRIFCRDRLYQEAGKPLEVPEWKSVRPTDKKLIGYLTWRWKREGYDWSIADGPKPSSNEEVDLAAKMDTLSLEDSGSVETKSHKTVLVIGQDFSATIPTHLRFVGRDFGALGRIGGK